LPASAFKLGVAGNQRPPDATILQPTIAVSAAGNRGDFQVCAADLDLVGRPDHSGALIGTGANNCKLIVVKPEKRDGYMPDPLMTQPIKEAAKHGVPIEEITVPAREWPES